MSTHFLRLAAIRFPLLFVISWSALPSTCPVQFQKLEWDTTPPLYVFQLGRYHYWDKWFELKLRRTEQDIKEIELTGMIVDAAGETIPLPFPYYLQNISRGKTFKTILPSHLNWDGHYWQQTRLHLSIARVEFRTGTTWTPELNQECAREANSVLDDRLR